MTLSSMSSSLNVWLLLQQPEVVMLNNDLGFGRAAGERALRSRVCSGNFQDVLTGEEISLGRVYAGERKKRYTAL